MGLLRILLGTIAAGTMLAPRGGEQDLLVEPAPQTLHTGDRAVARLALLL